MPRDSPIRIAVLGNSGSGKSTLARWLGDQAAVVTLDLDTVAWEPDQIAVPRAADEARHDVQRCCSNNDEWVIEGCYTYLIAEALQHNPKLVFLNPGESQCLLNCSERPWEDHKYESKQQQDERLDLLLRFVSEYYHRQDDISLFAHRLCYDNYQGSKLELSRRPVFEPADPELLACLR